MRIDLVKKVELHKVGNSVICHESRGPVLNNSLKSTVVGNRLGGKKKPFYVTPGSKACRYATIPVTIDDIIVQVECDVNYNIIIDIMRIQSISKNTDNKIYASCIIIERYINDKWINNIHEEFSEIVQAALLRATSLKKTAVYVDYSEINKNHA